MSGNTRGMAGEQRGNRLIQEEVHDPYRNRKKLREPSYCAKCGALYQKGRWTWGEKPDGAQPETCPACTRVAENQPAGILTLSGDFFADHRDEIINLARNEEEKEKGQHPLHRIMNIESGGSTIITTTDINLPRRIGKALHSAYGGDLDINYQESDYFIRVNWSR